MNKELLKLVEYATHHDYRDKKKRNKKKREKRGTRQRFNVMFVLYFKRIQK